MSLSLEIFAVACQKKDDFVEDFCLIFEALSYKKLIFSESRNVVVDSIFAQFSDLERDMQVLCYFLYIFA